MLIVLLASRFLCGLERFDYLLVLDLIAVWLRVVISWFTC